MNRKLSLLTTIAVVLNVMAFAGTQAGTGNSVPFDLKFLRQLEVPRYRWLHNNKILLLDNRVDEKERTLEILEPETGKRSPALDRQTVLAGLKKLCPEDAPQTIEWPAAVDGRGSGVVYILNGDLFLVKTESSHVRRLTETAAEEKSAAFSPDGKWLGFIRDNEIYAVDLRGNKEKRLTFGASDTLYNGPLSWVYWEEIYDHTDVPYAWSPDSEAIAYLLTDDSPVSVSTFIHFKPATQQVVRQRYPKAGQPNPKVRLGIVEIATAQTTWMECGDYEYLARFNWLPEGKRIAVQTLDRPQQELRLLFADRATGKSEHILTDLQPGWINLNHSLYFFKTKERFIWLSERDGYQHLYLYRLDGRLIRQLTKGAFMVVSATGQLTGGNGGLTGVDEKAGLVHFTSSRKALKERHLYRIRLNGKGLIRLSRGDGVHAVLFSPNMNYYLDQYANASQPPQLTLHRANGIQLSTIAPAMKQILSLLNFRPPEFHTFKTRDGLELPAMMIKPANFDPRKKYPAVVIIYGGPGAQQVIDRWSTYRALRYYIMARDGYFVFVVEVRAGMGQNKALETSVYKRAYGMQNVKDILDGVKWIKQLPYIDADRLGIMGGSGGGCTTLFAMTHSDIFKAGISLYPVSDWGFYDSIYTERYLNTPQENPEGYKETSCVRAAADLKGRLLIVHGTYDDNVHPQNTQAFIHELIGSGIQFDLMIYPWEKHGVRNPRAMMHLMTLIRNFWRQNL